MAGGQSGGTRTGLVRHLRRTAHVAVLATVLPALAATPSSTPAPPGIVQPKLAKPSAYHSIEPAAKPAKPLPKPVAAPAQHGHALPSHALQAKVQPVTQPQTHAGQLQAQLVPAPQLASRIAEPHAIETPAVPIRAQMKEQPRKTPGYQPYLPSRQYAHPNPRPPSRPGPLMTAYPETAPPPYARRIIYQDPRYPGNNNQRRENAPNAAEHLPAWMRKHQNESAAERERSLRQEPGFNRLAPVQQQNLVNTLRRLDEMPPEQRERTLMRMENMERLSPQMREAVRSSARQLNDMLPDRRRMWQRAFRDLRDMPPEQRQEVLRSQEFAGQFSAQERSIMGNLLAVEPYRNPGPMQAPPIYGR